VSEPLPQSVSEQKANSREGLDAHGNTASLWPYRTSDPYVNRLRKLDFEDRHEVKSNPKYQLEYLQNFN